ncbi:hypothetical protein H6F76_08855 [Leptolyngbya sp. FACHB-321]|uniref:hypothetical protein n=1 Tax=Leptolyngbya sp. FACHB-321 TaxID=2692807 RepID=UPI0016858AFE|nr:hypothetical protein [Leptolyngbya sp. FACHB-321]MBD2035136.1 hypothetical protein [Leptolyngbya sp. FACHB-321]
MRNPITTVISPWFSPACRARRILAGLSLTVGLLGVGLVPAIANAEASTQSQVAKQALPDGIYLYGQSTQPNQVGQGYFVFESKQGNVVGALYMPRSSFDCASGKFQNDQLALTVVNSYDRTTNPFEIALERNSNVASQGNPAFSNLGLQGFERISNVSENDQRILDVCKADFQKQTTAK